LNLNRDDVGDDVTAACEGAEEDTGIFVPAGSETGEAFIYSSLVK